MAAPGCRLLLLQVWGKDTERRPRGPMPCRPRLAGLPSALRPSEPPVSALAAQGQEGGAPPATRVQSRLPTRRSERDGLPGQVCGPSLRSWRPGFCEVPRRIPHAAPCSAAAPRPISTLCPVPPVPRPPSHQTLRARGPPGLSDLPPARLPQDMPACLEMQPHTQPRALPASPTCRPRPRRAGPPRCNESRTSSFPLSVPRATMTDRSSRLNQLCRQRSR